MEELSLVTLLTGELLLLVVVTVMVLLLVGEPEVVLVVTVLVFDEEETEGCWLETVVYWVFEESLLWVTVLD